MTSTKPRIFQLHVPLLLFDMAFPASQCHSAFSLVFIVAQLISLKSTKQIVLMDFSYKASSHFVSHSHQPFLKYYITTYDKFWSNHFIDSRQGTFITKKKKRERMRKCWLKVFFYYSNLAYTRTLTS